MPNFVAEWTRCEKKSRRHNGCHDNKQVREAVASGDVTSLNGRRSRTCDWLLTAAVGGA